MAANEVRMNLPGSDSVPPGYENIHQGKIRSVARRGLGVLNGVHRAAKGVANLGVNVGGEVVENAVSLFRAVSKPFQKRGGVIVLHTFDDGSQVELRGEKAQEALRNREEWGRAERLKNFGGDVSWKEFDALLPSFAEMKKEFDDLARAVGALNSEESGYGLDALSGSQSGSDIFSDLPSTTESGEE